MKKIAVLFVLFMVVCATCSAKFIYDDTGRISVEAPNDWFYSQGSDDGATYCLFVAQKDKDTAIFLKQSKSKFKPFYEMSETELSVARDNLIRWHMNLFKLKGYEAYINKVDYSKKGIVMGFTVIENSNSYKFVVSYWSKSPAIFSIGIMGTDKTSLEAMQVASTLRIDGLAFDKWEYNP